MNWLKSKLKAWLEVPETASVRELCRESEDEINRLMDEASIGFRRLAWLTDRASTDHSNTLMLVQDADEKLNSLAAALGVTVVGNTIEPVKGELFQRGQALLAEMELRDLREIGRKARAVLAHLVEIEAKAERQRFVFDRADRPW